MSVTECSGGTANHPGTASGQHWLGIDQTDCLGDEMEEEHLTVDQCDELAKALREDAARLPHGSERELLVQLAEDYSILADLKRMVLRKVN
jgi:hypothetical protein